MTDAHSRQGQPGLGHSIRGIANWILDEAENNGLSISNMAINKLAYFVYEAYLLNFKKIITPAKIEAWEHGPVFRELYQSFKMFGDRPIADRAKSFNAATGQLETASVSLSPADADFFRSILEPLLPLSAARLRAISHAENSPWWQVWWYDGEVNPGMEITPELILSQAGRSS